MSILFWVLHRCFILTMTTSCHDILKYIAMASTYCCSCACRRNQQKIPWSHGEFWTLYLFVLRHTKNHYKALWELIVIAFGSTCSNIFVFLDLTLTEVAKVNLSSLLGHLKRVIFLGRIWLLVFVQFIHWHILSLIVYVINVWFNGLVL